MELNTGSITPLPAVNHVVVKPCPDDIKSEPCTPIATKLELPVTSNDEANAKAVQALLVLLNAKHDDDDPPHDDGAHIKSSPPREDYIPVTECAILATNIKRPSSPPHDPAESNKKPRLADHGHDDNSNSAANVVPPVSTPARAPAARPGPASPVRANNEIIVALGQVNQSQAAGPLLPVPSSIRTYHNTADDEVYSYAPNHPGMQLVAAATGSDGTALTQHVVASHAKGYWMNCLPPHIHALLRWVSAQQWIKPPGSAAAGDSANNAATDAGSSLSSTVPSEHCFMKPSLAEVPAQHMLSPLAVFNEYCRSHKLQPVYREVSKTQEKPPVIEVAAVAVDPVLRKQVHGPCIAHGTNSQAARHAAAAAVLHKMLLDGVKCEEFVTRKRTTPLPRKPRHAAPPDNFAAPPPSSVPAAAPSLSPAPTAAAPPSSPAPTAAAAAPPPPPSLAPTAASPPLPVLPAEQVAAAHM